MGILQKIYCAQVPVLSVEEVVANDGRKISLVRCVELLEVEPGQILTFKLSCLCHPI